MPRVEQLGKRSITIEAKRLGTLMGLQSGASGPHAILGPSHSDAATTALTRGDILGCVGSATLDAINIGGSGTYLRSDGTDPAWTALQTADMPALPTPGTCTVATSNSGTAPHTHAITSSSNPGAAASLLASDASGYLQLERLGLGISPSYILDLYDASSLRLNIKSNTSEASLYLQGEGTSNSAAINLLDHGSGYYWHIPMRASDHATAADDLNFFFHDGSYNLYARFDVSAQAAIFPNIMSVGHTGAWGLLDVRQSTTTGPTIYAYRNLASGSTDSPVLRVVQDNAGDDQAAVYVQQDGTGDLLYLTGTGMTAQVTASGRLGVGVSPSAGVQIETSSTLQALIARATGDAMTAQFLRDVASATDPVVNIVQQNATGLRPVLRLDQYDVDKPFIEFLNGTIYTGKTGADEYLMVLNPSGNTRYIRLYS